MSDIAAGLMRIPFTHFPADRITDSSDVEDRIHNAVLAERRRLCGQAEELVAEERERCAKIADDRSTLAGISREYEQGASAACFDIAAKIRSGE